MKKLLVTIIVLIAINGLISAQSNIFKKVNLTELKPTAVESIEKMKTKRAIKQWETVKLNPNVIFSKNQKGVINIFNKNLSFVVDKDFGIDISGVRGFGAEIKDGGNALISVSGNRILISIWYKDIFYSIETIEDGIQFVSEINLTELAKNECEVKSTNNFKLNKTIENKSLNKATTIDTIRVLLAYTSDVTNIDLLKDQCQNNADLVLGFSGITGVKIKIVEKSLFNYSLSGYAATDLGTFQNNNYIKGLRNQYQADVCVLLVSTLWNSNGYDIAGLAAAIQTSYENAYCIVQKDAAVGQYTFIHELGHLFGGRHQFPADSNTENSHGKAYKHNNIDTDPLSFRTVMAINGTFKYNGNVYDYGIPRRVGYFSNPSINEPISGVPTGDNAQTYVVGEINYYAPTIAAFQPRYTTSGTISVNEWWRGNITVTGTVTVESGVTLTVEPGATISFASGASLTVNGTLSAVCNTSNPITFTRSGTSGTWNGIQFNSGSSGTVQYCTITYATDGVYCYNASPQIKYNTIQNCSNGVYLNYYSSPTIAGNTIKENTSTGVSCWNYSSPTFNDGYGDGNVIRNNSSYGVQARYNSNPNLNKGSYGYGNSVKNNTYNELIAEFNCTVTARNVWWGNNPPLDSQFYLYGGSTLDRANPLTFDPYPSRNVIAENVDYQASVNTLSKIVSSIGDDNLNLALDKQKDKKYDEAIPLFLEVFKNNKDALLGKYALSKIEECYTQAGKKDYLDYSKKEIKPLLKDGSETYVEALELEAHQMVNLGLYKEAVNNLETILKKYNLNGEIEKNTLFTLGAFHNIFFGDKVNSDKYFGELKQKYPNDELVNQIEIVKGLGLAANGSVQSGNASTPLIETTPDVKTTVFEDAIINYPNPFNPSTRISFTLKDGGKVSLKVYDVLGKEVANLADGVYEVGKHVASFDGSNLASGIYFYRLVTPNATITKKMVLTK